MKTKYIVGAMAVAISLLLSGCVPQAQYDELGAYYKTRYEGQIAAWSLRHNEVAAENVALEQKVSRLEAELGVAKAEYGQSVVKAGIEEAKLALLQSKLAPLQERCLELDEQNAVLEGKYEALVVELEAIKAVYPLRDFSGLVELSQWRTEVGIVEAGYSFDSCQKLQRLAFNNGYFLSIRTQDSGGCLAVAGHYIYQIRPDSLGAWKVGHTYPPMEKDLEDES